MTAMVELTIFGAVAAVALGVSIFGAILLVVDAIRRR